MMTETLVSLTYYHINGKYHSEGSYMTTQINLEDVVIELKKTFKKNIYPGLNYPSVNWIVIVYVPIYISCHPVMIVPDKVAQVDHRNNFYKGKE